MSEKTNVVNISPYLYKRMKPILRRADYSSEREYADALQNDFLTRAKKDPSLYVTFMQRIREAILEDIEEEREAMQCNLEKRLSEQKRQIKRFRWEE